MPEPAPPPGSTPRRKVLLLCHSYGLNGACVLLLRLARHWVEALGWEVWALVHPALAQQDGHHLKNAGVGLLYEVRAQDLFDFCLINTVLDIGHAERVSKLMPVALWVHESSLAIMNNELKVAQLYRLFECCQKLIFQTEWQSERVFGSFTHRLPAGRVSVVDNGIVEIPSPNPEKVHRPGPLDIVFLGNLYPNKRPGDLAQAVAQLSRQHDVHCTLIGETRFLTGFPAPEVELMRTHRAITLTGPMAREAALKRVAQADVLVMCSSDESQPLVPLEAASLKVPVILSRIPMLAYSGWVEGDNCLMYEVGDVTGLASCLLLLQQTPALRERLGLSGHALSRRFALPLFLQRMTKTLEQLQAGRQSLMKGPIEQAETKGPRG